MKKIAEKKCYFTYSHILYWSAAYQSLPISSRNLLQCMIAELRWEKRKKSRALNYTNNGQISFTEVEFKFNELGCSETYLRARNKLVEVGLIRITKRGGMTRGDMNQYKLLFIDGVTLDEQRWRMYPHKNWKDDIPERKDTLVGLETRKNINPTLKNVTHNKELHPKECYPYSEIHPNQVGSNTLK